MIYFDKSQDFLFGTISRLLVTHDSPLWFLPQIARQFSRQRLANDQARFL